jgi:hypothetical protein
VTMFHIFHLSKCAGVFQYLCAVCIPRCKEDPIYVFPEMKLRGLFPTSHIHVSVSDKYIPRIGLPILLLVHECRNWERGRAVSFLGIFVSLVRKCSFFAVLLNRMGHFQIKEKIAKAIIVWLLTHQLKEGGR